MSEEVAEGLARRVRRVIGLGANVRRAEPRTVSVTKPGPDFWHTGLVVKYSAGRASRFLKPQAIETKIDAEVRTANAQNLSQNYLWVHEPKAKLIHLFRKIA